MRRSAKRVSYFVAGALSLARGASADDGGRFSFEWSAPPGCPDRQAMRDRVDALLGAPALTLLRQPLGVRGVVTQAEPGAELLLQTTDNGLPGERTIRGASCQEVSAAGALVVALAIDPRAVAEHRSTGATAAFEQPGAPPPPAAPPPATPTEPPVATPLPAPAPALERPPRETALEGRLFVEGLLDVGTLPEIALGAGASGGFGTRLFGVEVGAAYLLPEFAQESPDKGADVSLFLGGVTGCYRALPGPVELRACARAELGALFADGTGFQKDDTGVAFLLGMGLGGEAVFQGPGPLLVRVGLAGVVPIVRPVAQFTNADGKSEELHGPSPIVGRATIGVGLAFR